MKHSGVTLSPVQNTLIKQIQAQNPFFFSDYGIQVLLKEGNDTLRFHTKNDGNTINIRIRYNRSLDVYEIQGWHIDGVEHELIGDYDMVLFDKLDETIKEILKEGSGEGGKR